MNSEPRRPSRQDNASIRAGATLRSGMAGWRWLLFAAMARLELREDVYLRIPGAEMPGRASHIAIDQPENAIRSGYPSAVTNKTIAPSD